MSSKKILVISGSTRRESLNRKLASAVTAQLREKGMVVTMLDMAEYELPLYNGDIESQHGIPDAAHHLHEAFRTHQGVFIASPEYNANVSPLLINVIAWLSRIQEHGGFQSAFGKPVYALGSASPGGFGGYRGLMALRSMLELALGARVLPAMVSVGMAHEAINDHGEIIPPMPRQMLDRMVSQLVEATAY